MVHHWKIVWKFKLNIELSYDLEIPFLDVFLREMKTYVHTKTCIWVSIAALFTTTRRWKEPKYPSKDEWLVKMCYVHTVEYYLAIKRNETLTHTHTHTHTTVNYCSVNYHRASPLLAPNSLFCFKQRHVNLIILNVLLTSGAGWVFIGYGCSIHSNV